MVATEGGMGSVPDEVPGFVDRVWRVAESPQVEQGSLRVFLSEGTLVMASPYAEPALGSWSYEGGDLTITEEGLTYEVEIVALDEERFRIRIHGSDEPIDIRFERAARALEEPQRPVGQHPDETDETLESRDASAGVVFRATGNEPFWLLEITEGKHIRFVFAAEQREVLTPVPEPEVDETAGTRLYHAVTEAHDLRVLIERKRCIDDMSGRPHEATVTVTLDEETYRGCGESD